MRQEAIDVEILKTDDQNLEVKLPFLDIPITMNYDFFRKRVANGYFKVDEKANISPWIVVRTNEREKSRIEAMKYVLSLVDYEGKSTELTPPNENELFNYKPY